MGCAAWNRGTVWLSPGPLKQHRSPLPSAVSAHVQTFLDVNGGTLINRPDLPPAGGGVHRGFLGLHLQSRSGSLCPKGRPQGDTAGEAGLQGLKQIPLHAPGPTSCPAQPGETRLRIDMRGSCGWRERLPRGQESPGEGCWEPGVRAGSCECQAVCSRHLRVESQGLSGHHLGSQLSSACRRTVLLTSSLCAWQMWLMLVSLNTLVSGH